MSTSDTSRALLPNATKSYDNDEEDVDLEISTSISSTRKGVYHFQRRFIIFLLLGSLLINAILVTIISRVKDRDKICRTHTSQYETPILSEAPVTYQTITFNGSLLDETVYRKPAGPQVDKAWNDLGIDYRSVGLSPSEARASGLQSGQVKLSENDGGDYIATVEVLHHLHCLNLVRKSVYFNYEYYQQQGVGNFADSPAITQAHIGHCIDLIRQALMCHGDTGLLGQYWVRKTNAPFYDFNTDHMCVNFEAIKQWAEKRQIPEGAVAEAHVGDAWLPDFP